MHNAGTRLSGHIDLIIGVPGWGKTFLLTAIMAQWAMLGMPCLVGTGTIAATNSLANRIDELLRSKDFQKLKALQDKWLMRVPDDAFSGHLWSAAIDQIRADFIEQGRDVRDLKQTAPKQRANISMDEDRMF